ncbi:MAG TPA: TetR/AcrR family transcriptional regulator [Solirubrobacteraceae bacterium]|nr:TetR/AcrR family transcriptional regulator [Solirubrobacteraceae bacterium]
MGRSKEDKAASHERIVEVAAARIRESGTVAPGVAEIMQAAGLTHGGFYKHFASRDDLVAAAVDRALADGEDAMATITADADDPLAAFVDWYASSAHRDDPAHGCAVAALGCDVPRAEDRVRAAYRAQVQRYIAHLEQLLGGDEDCRRRAIVAVSALVGGLLIARAIDDEALSEEILRDVRDAVKAL